MEYISPEFSFSPLNNNDVMTTSPGTTKPTPGGSGTTIIPR